MTEREDEARSRRDSEAAEIDEAARQQHVWGRPANQVVTDPYCWDCGCHDETAGFEPGLCTRCLRYRNEPDQNEPW